MTEIVELSNKDLKGAIIKMLQWAIMNTLKAKETVVYPPSFIPDIGHFYLLFYLLQVGHFYWPFHKAIFLSWINKHIHCLMKPNRPKLLSVYLSQLSINSFISNLLCNKTKIFRFFFAINKRWQRAQPSKSKGSWFRVRKYFFLGRRFIVSCVFSQFNI